MTLPRIISIVLFTIFVSGLAQANGVPRELRDVGFDQRLNERIPGELLFYDEHGAPVRLGDLRSQKPTILALVYFECPNLCPLVLDGIVRSLKAISLEPGKDFDILAVSIDPREGPAIAAAKKEEFVRRYGRPGAERGWHFLTGDETSIAKLTQAAGFRYSYDAEKKQYAHASGLVILTPQGRVSRYLYGIEYAPRDLRLSLVEASAGKIGTAVDKVLLFCYQYDPATGKYTLVIMNSLRLAGVATVLALGSFLLVMFRRERRGGS